MNYAKPILILGYLIPGILLVSLLAGILFGKSWIDNEYEKRKNAHEELQENQRKIASLEAEVLPHRGAIAFFDQAKNVRISQDLPPMLEDLCNGKYQGYVIRTGLRIGDQGGKERATMEFLGRYDALQKLTGDLSAQFPYLKFSGGSFSPKDATTSVPTKHLSITVDAYNDVEIEEVEQ
jgi:hypothetical protein